MHKCIGPHDRDTSKVAHPVDCDCNRTEDHSHIDVDWSSNELLDI